MRRRRPSGTPPDEAGRFGLIKRGARCEPSLAVPHDSSVHSFGAFRPADSPILTASSPGHGYSTLALCMFINYEHGPGRRDHRRSEQPRFIHREISMRFEESVEQASEEIIDWVDWDRFL